MSADPHRLITESLDDVVSLHDLEGRILYVSPSVQRLTGYAPEELIGHPAHDLVHPDDKLRFGQPPPSAPEGPREVECRLRTRVGDYRWVATHKQVLRDPAGHPFRVLNSSRDITERKQVEDALRQSHNLLRAVSEGIPDAVYVKDSGGRYLLMNAAGLRILGKSAAEVLGHDVAGLFDAASAEFIRATEQEIMTHGVTRTYEQVLPVGGEPRTYLVTKGPYRDERGAVLGVFGIARDVTERRRFEEQVRQAQKLEAVGRLAGGVAHDFNNLLTIVTGYCSVLMESHGPGDPAHEPLREILRAAERGAALTRQLLAFGRRQMLSPTVLDLNAVILHLGEVFKRLLGPQVRLTLDLDPFLHRIKVDRVQIEQVLLDLAANARDAMPVGGQLTLTTANRVESPAEGAPAEGGAVPIVRLTVADTGGGMEAATRERLFEPFFTTKEAGKGSGLGLASVYGIVTQCGGHIDVASTPGQGTVFTLSFPALPTPQLAPPAERAAGEQGGETILLVDDECAVRALARYVLQTQGYTVLEARHGQEALDFSERHGGPIHLLVSDVVMPHMSGAELAGRLCARYPDLRVLFLSGSCDENLELEPEGGRHRRRFLPKPFRPSDLLFAVQELLSEGKE